jgi:hypothetical protein
MNTRGSEALLKEKASSEDEARSHRESARRFNSSLIDPRVCSQTGEVSLSFREGAQIATFDRVVAGLGVRKEGVMPV